MLSSMMKRTPVLLVILASIAACETPTPQPTMTSIPYGCTEPGGVVTIRVHDWSSVDRQHDWDEVIDEFNESHPCIRADSVALTSDRSLRIKELLSSPNVPDLIGMDSADLTHVERLGLLTDLNPLAATDNFVPEDHLVDQAYRPGIVDGKQIAIAKDFSVSATYVNVGLIERAGFTLPNEDWTYDTYLKMARKLTFDSDGNDSTSPAFNPNSVDVWGMILGNWEGDLGWWRGFQSYLYSWGAHTISPDGKRTDGYINSEKAVAAWIWYRDLMYKYHVAPSASYFGSSGMVSEDYFKQGKVAVAATFWGPWHQEKFNLEPGLNWAVVPLPLGPGGHHAANMWMGWGISAKSKHPGQAWQLLKWLTTTPGQQVFSRRALTGDKTVLKQRQLDKDPFWGVFLAEMPFQDPLDDMTASCYMSCVEFPAKKLLGKLYQETAANMNIKVELDNLAATADMCLAGTQTADPCPDNSSVAP